MLALLVEVTLSLFGLASTLRARGFVDAFVGVSGPNVSVIPAVTLRWRQRSTTDRRHAESPAMLISTGAVIWQG